MKLEPGMAYDIKKLNKVFAILSVIFLISIMWLFLDDYIKPWKAVQIKALDVKRQVLSEQIAEEDKNIDPEKLKELAQREVQAHQEVEKNEDKIVDYKRDLRHVEKLIYSQNMTNGELGSLASEWQFKYEHYHVAGAKTKETEAKKKMSHFKKLFDGGRDQLKTLQQQEATILAKIKDIESLKANVERDIKAIRGTRDRLSLAHQQAGKNPIWYLRNAPFIDYLDPTVKINQIVLSDLSDDRYFQKTAKVDRCTTCHVFIDQKGFEQQENPYKTHPKLDQLAVGAGSPHPMKKFGCTTCHGGEGHRVLDFQSAAHTPQNDQQKKEWETKYGWHAPHKIPQPMLPLQYTESSCVKCHQGEDRLLFADKHNKGRELIENYGCYGCHKIEGWQSLKKPGPSLEKITGKLSKEFIKNWIWSPHTFNAHSRMPAYFSQANNSTEEFAKFNIAEVNAMTEYLYAQSKSYEPFIRAKSGNSQHGKELIQTIGCVACHQVEGIDEPYSKVKSLSGPYLAGLGSKLNKDWLVSWLLKPSHYQASTIMPSFRLSEQEANDITAYLLSSRNKTFEQLEFAQLDPEVVNQLLVEYFSAFDPKAVAEKNVALLSEKDQVMELGKRSLGKYGCYSCHDIPSMGKDLPPIGPELSKVGSKFVEKFGWGQQHHLEHSRHSWVWHHLQQPSRWDIGVPKVFKELNIMPNYYLDEDELTLMTGYLLGLVDEFVPMTGKKKLSGAQQVASEGRKIAAKYNCQGCHVIDGIGGKITEAYAEDQNSGPPWLVVEGHRVQTEWLYNFLQNVYPIRPYVKLRMPTFNFSHDELNKVVAYFQLEAGQSIFTDHGSKVVWDSGEREAAKKMFEELACVSCHTAGFNKELEQGPDLHKINKRLRESWVQKWLREPQAILPYTPMPNFWDGGKASAVPGVLGDDPERQIKAMTKYLYEMSSN